MFTATRAVKRVLERRPSVVAQSEPKSHRASDGVQNPLSGNGEALDLTVLLRLFIMKFRSRILSELLEVLPLKKSL